ncbi:MAG: LytTR family DNA-binding domain-containing protein [Gammaproteobacteria bacterium]|nr:LytTR family DNA-binding domain-containing protein [Gammaproteobacteria bacterium]
MNDAVVTALVVEDEPLSFHALEDLIAEISWLKLIGHAANGADAVKLIDGKHPDVVFLDVELPEKSGITVLDEIIHQPLIIFTTAYEEHAVDAFRYEAVDYLVKPFGQRRFGECMERIHKRIFAPPQESQPAKLSDWLFAKAGRLTVPLHARDVDRFEAGAGYVHAFVGDKTYTLNKTLSQLEKRLDENQFLRIHRAHIINLEKVAGIRPYDERRMEIELSNGSKIISSRAGAESLRELMD